MIKRKPQEEFTLMEAVDHLSHIAELDLTQERIQEVPFEREETVKLGRVRTIDWSNPKELLENNEVVKQTFRVLHRYLQTLYEKDKGELKDLETQRGIQAIMSLAGEAAQKMDRLTTLFQETHPEETGSKLQEYQDLQQYYQTKIMKRFHHALEKEEAWQAEKSEIGEDTLDIQRRGLKDLETVRKDRDYDLFYIRKEDGHPFFNKNLLRHIKLVGEFDEALSDPEGDDPLLKIKVIQDRAVHEMAKQLLHLAAPALDEFYKEALRHKEMHLASSLNKALMALMLCANARNLIQNTEGKSCYRYFSDFQLYLRQALESLDYQQGITSAPQKGVHFLQGLIHLTHALCSYFFTLQSPKTEVVEFIYRLIKNGQKDAQVEEGEGSPLSMWNRLLDQDESIRYLLKRYPSGPLLKTLDFFRDGQENQGFDPLVQENLPAQLFTFGFDETHVTCLRLPAPLSQVFINQATVTEEFRGFLRSLTGGIKEQKHLFINLQDRTSWHEHARCVAIEELQKNAEFSHNIVVVTLPKNTEFYLQSASYQYLNDAKAFLTQFKEQIASREACGFYFPSSLNTAELESFIDKTLGMIHKIFFSSKDILSRKNRLDFIEIFYQFFILKCVEMIKPDSMSLTCKDSVDIGASAGAAFFSFLKILSSDQPWTSEDQDQLLYLLYAPSLLVRERAIDIQCFNRMVSALAVMHGELGGDRKAVLEAFTPYYEPQIFKKIRVQES